MVFKKGHKINLGRKQTEYQKQKMSKIHKGKIISEETKQKIKEARERQIMPKGEKHWNYGKKLSKETKKKISSILKGRIFNEEHKQKLKEHLKNYMFKKGHIPYNKFHPEIMPRAEKSWNWIGGKAKCLDCGKELSSYTSFRCLKCSKKGNNHPLWGKHFSKESREKMSKAKQYIIIPKRDTSIEIKIQNYLKELHIEFVTHNYISDITHGYQCDILIPSTKTIIETDGCYWHGCKICNKNINKFQLEHITRDKIRTKELQEKGFKVIRLWEHEIKIMELNDLKNELTNSQNFP